MSQSVPISQSINAFKVYLEGPVLRLFGFGIAAGLPIMLVFSSLSFWLREAGVERSTIGFFSWVTLAYAMKWLWAPLVDRLSIPVLTKKVGRRKSWLLLSQICLVAAISAMAFTDPAQSLYFMAVAAVLVAFCSATQDIMIDAFRIESGSERQQAAMAASYMIGYRLAMIIATAGVLLLTAFAEPESSTTTTQYHYAAWQFSYLCMAFLMACMCMLTMLSPEPHGEPNQNPNNVPQTLTTQSNKTQIGSAINQPRSSNQYSIQRIVALFSDIFYALKKSFIDPVLDLISRYRSVAIWLIIIVATYRISDVVMGVMANVFYVDMGYSKEEIASVSKVFGVVMTLLGAFFSGGLINRYGILPILLVGGVLSAITNLLFVLLSTTGHSINLLIAVISIDNLSAGIAMAALIAFLSSLTNKEFTATQYAWLSSAMILLPKSIGGFSGVMLESMGYTQFFTMTAVIGIPAIVSLLVLMKKGWSARVSSD